MDVECITFPIKTFSRIEYFSTNSSVIQSRFNILNCKNGNKIHSPQFVKLHLCKKIGETEFPIKTHDILEKPETFSVKIRDTGKYKSLKCYLKSRKEFDTSISLLIVDSKAKREIAKLGITTFHIILVANDDITKKELIEEFKDVDEVKITIAKKESISKDLNNLLERISLAPLKKICEDCYRMLPLSKMSSARTSEKKHRKIENSTGYTFAHASNYYQNNTEEETSIMANKVPPKLRTNHLQNSNSHLAETSRSQYQQMSGAKQDIKRNNWFSRKRELFDVEFKSPDLSNKHVDDNECLLEAILALYRMSNVPEKDKPDVPTERLREVTEELRDHLFETCPTIRRLGYRYRTFTIYADKLKSSTDEAARKSKLALLLKKHGVYDYAIISNAEDITPLMYVGAKIEARSESTISLRSRPISRPAVVHGGTLGCVVRTNDGGQCGVFSGHVGRDCSDVYYIGSNSERRLGHILPETNRHQPGSLDISAVSFEEHIDDAERRFRNMQGNDVQGQIYHYRRNIEDGICGKGMPVYIRGASTNPGRGEITMPFVDVGMSSTLIQIEDRIIEDGTVQDRFAAPGDSGAIVCADVPGNDVHALGMVVGTTTLAPGEDSLNTRRQYFSIPLSDGLQQLENQTGKNFEL